MTQYDQGYDDYLRGVLLPNNADYNYRSGWYAAQDDYQQAAHELDGYVQQYNAQKGGR